MYLTTDSKRASYEGSLTRKIGLKFIYGPFVQNNMQSTHNFCHNQQVRNFVPRQKSAKVLLS